MGRILLCYPKADLLDVKVGGVDVKPASGGAYLKERDFEKLKRIFWANNITGVSPELPLTYCSYQQFAKGWHSSHDVLPIGLWFDHAVWPIDFDDRCAAAASVVEDCTARWPTNVVRQPVAADAGSRQFAAQRS